MRISRLLLAIVVFTVGCGQEASQVAGPVDETGPVQIEHVVLDAEARARLQTLVDRASAVQRVRVVEIHDEDQRPACGSLLRVYTLEVLASSGAVVERLSVTLDPGGMRPAGQYTTAEEVEQREAELDREFLQQGETYWLLLGTPTPADTLLTQGLLAWWPEGATPEMIPTLVGDDAYHWRPVYSAAAEVSYGYVVESPERWRLIVKQDGELLWEHAVANDPALGNDDAELSVHGPRYGMDPVDAPDTETPMLLLYSATRVTLAADNRFGVPADSYRIRTACELHTGQLLAEWVLTLGHYNELAMRQVDRDTGGLVSSIRYESLDTGGIVVGGEQDAWFRKTQVRYDVGGEAISTEVFRHGSVTDEDGTHLYNGWVPVE